MKRVSLILITMIKGFGPNRKRFATIDSRFTAPSCSAGLFFVRVPCIQRCHNWPLVVPIGRVVGEGDQRGAGWSICRVGR